MNNVIKAVKMPFQFDTAKLKADLAITLKQDWAEIKSAFIEKESLFGFELLIPDLEKIIPGEGVILKRSPMLNQCKYFQYVLDAFPCRLLRARLNLLKSQCCIPPHTDQYGYRTGEIRLHIPVQTNDDFRFTIEGERIVLKEGECWYVNTLLKHDVVNNGQEDRIHLVIDCSINDWLEGVLSKLGLQAHSHSRNPG